MLSDSRSGCERSVRKKSFCDRTQPRFAGSSSTACEILTLLRSAGEITFTLSLACGDRDRSGILVSAQDGPVTTVDMPSGATRPPRRSGYSLLAFSRVQKRLRPSRDIGGRRGKGVPSSGEKIVGYCAPFLYGPVTENLLLLR